MGFPLPSGDLEHTVEYLVLHHTNSYQKRVVFLLLGLLLASIAFHSIIVVSLPCTALHCASFPGYPAGRLGQRQTAPRSPPTGNEDLVPFAIPGSSCLTTTATAKPTLPHTTTAAPSPTCLRIFSAPSFLRAFAVRRIIRR